MTGHRPPSMNTAPPANDAGACRLIAHDIFNTRSKKPHCGRCEKIIAIGNRHRHRTVNVELTGQKLIDGHVIGLRNAESRSVKRELQKLIIDMALCTTETAPIRLR